MDAVHEAEILGCCDVAEGHAWTLDLWPIFRIPCLPPKKEIYSQVGVRTRLPAFRVRGNRC